MRWAVLFLPRVMTVFTRRETNVLLNLRVLGHRPSDGLTSSGHVIR